MGVNHCAFDDLYCLHLKLYCFFKVFGGLPQEIIFCSDCISMPCLPVQHFVHAEHSLLLDSEHLRILRRLMIHAG